MAERALIAFDKDHKTGQNLPKPAKSCQILPVCGLPRLTPSGITRIVGFTLG
jgi:hypothetical protein